MLTLTYVLSLCVSCILALDRHYYLAAVEEDWDYAPTGRDVTATNASDAWIFLNQGYTRIGHVYKKAIYRQFTDDTYSKEIPKPGWLGMLGPTLHGELGDIIYVHFWNKARRHYSVHPHGVRYTKDKEGALYLDNTVGADKIDDMVPPGTHYLYSWNITKNFAPARDDLNCISWAYHSHVLTTRDTNTGLIGCLVTCKPGVLNLDGSRRDVDQEFVLLAKVYDENKSWYLNDNLDKCGNSNTCFQLRDANNADFIQSNLMYSINGYSYGNGPGFPTCIRNRAAWHIMSMGSNSDLHSIHFDGQVVELRQHVMDTIRVAPAIFESGMMTLSTYPGQWLISCQIAHHYMSGMLAYLNVGSCSSDWSYYKTSHDQQVDRKYFLSAEEIVWDYAPSGQNLFLGGRLDRNGSSSFQVYAARPNRIGRRYKKALYFEYTDASYSKKVARRKSEIHLGFLGPIIRVEEGEIVQVYLNNMASRPYSFVPHGAYYSKSSEGSVYRTKTKHGKYEQKEMNGLISYPGKTVVYTFEAPVLGKRDPPCKVFPYQSSVNFLKDLNTGLIGPLVICKKGVLHYGKPVNIDRELFLLFSVTDENVSWYLEDNIAAFVRDKSNLDRMEEDFIRSNLLHVINGYGYGNLPGLDTCIGDRVMWHMFCVGNEFDVHTVFFHGHTFQRHSQHSDAEELNPQLSNSVIMDIDNPGKWAIVCRTGVHYQTGMQVLYNAQQCAYHSGYSSLLWSGFTGIGSGTGTTRQYFIAAIEIDWDYAPLKRGLITGESIMDPNSQGYIYVRKEGNYIGSVYRKAVYREFTDATFREMVKRDATEVHLDLLGPMIKAEVGDTIKIVFQNKASRAYSMHPQGVRYDKHNEGQVYLDGFPNKKSGRVQPGEIFVYTWHVPKSSGPGYGEANCIPWLYYSSHEPIKDPYSGLIGPLVICRKGYLDEAERRKDVDREFALLFFIVDENQSWYLADNIATYAPARLNTNFTTDPEFYQSNFMFTINGRIYGNNRGLVMTAGEHIVFYIFSHGSDKDVHTAHFHGQTYLQQLDGLHRADVLEVSAGVGRAVEIHTDNPGTWILHCHVNEHILGGMETTYTVLPRNW